MGNQNIRKGAKIKMANKLNELLGVDVVIKYLITDNLVSAYSWHYTEDKALSHLRNIMEYHNLHGKVAESEALNEWLLKELQNVVERGKRFKLPPFNYKNICVYNELVRVPRGETITYSELAKMCKMKYTDVLVTLMRNPFQVLIPCHRLLTKKGTLMGFYPLGKGVKRRLLELEGANI